MDSKSLRVVAVALAVVLACAVAGGVQAQRAARSASVVSHKQVIYLVRSTLLRLNDADRSGNYTVLRALAAPAFQAANTDADLAHTFSHLRRRGIDLSVVAVLTPHLTAAPALNGQGLLELSGYFPTQPRRLWFTLTFQDVSGKWRLMTVDVTVRAAPRKSTGSIKPS